MSKIKKDNYLKGIRLNRKSFQKYYKKSLSTKTEQQKLLEQLLPATSSRLRIADIACGYGTLTYHLSKKFKNASFTLVDYNKDALEEAKSINSKLNANYVLGSIYNLPFENEKFDLTFCWQTLLSLDKPQAAINELIRITKPGGSIYLSSMINMDHDVDIFCQAVDHTQPAGKQGLSFDYNTISHFTLKKWLKNKVNKFEIIPFSPKVDFSYSGRGLGTYTVKTSKERLQITGGILLNWVILHITI